MPHTQRSRHEERARFASVCRPRRLLRLAERALAVAVIVAIVGSGWSALQGMRRLLMPSAGVQPDRVAIDVIGEKLDSAMPVDAVRSLLNEGYWQVAGWPWELGLGEAGADEVDARLERLARRDDPPRVPVEFGTDAADLIEAVEKMSLPRTVEGDRSIYRLDNPLLKVLCAAIERGGRRQLVSLGGAVYDPTAGRWKVLELRPRSDRDPGSSGSLLPLPDGAQQLAARLDAQGRIVLELVELPGHDAHLSEWWRAKGWKIETAPFAEPGQFSYLCFRQGRYVHASSVGSVGSRMRLVLVEVHPNK